MKKSDYSFVAENEGTSGNWKRRECHDRRSEFQRAEWCGINTKNDATRSLPRLSLAQQLFEDCFVGLWKIQSCEFFKSYPAKRKRCRGLIRQSGAEPATPEMKLHIAVCIAVFDGCQVFSWNNQQSGFFTALTDRAGARRFIGFAFSAREFREACQRNTGRSYSDENSTG